MSRRRGCCGGCGGQALKLVSLQSASHSRVTKLFLSMGCGVVLAGSAWNGVAAEHTAPETKLVEYRTLAFQPKVWEQKGVSTLLRPSTGSNIVFLTTNGVYDPGGEGALQQRLHLAINFHR